MVTYDQIQIALKNPRVLCLPFHKSHIARLELSEYDRRTFNALGRQHLSTIFESVQDTRTGFTLFYDMKPLLCFGIETKWPGCAEVWMLPGVHLDNIPFTVAKGSRRLFHQLAAILHARRLQIVVNTTRPKAIRFAEFCGFQREGRMQEYGPEGDDYFMYARLF